MFENIDRRKLIIGGLVALLAIIAALILWWFLASRAVTPPAVAPPTQPETADLPGASLTVVPPASPQRLQADKDYPLGLKQLAMSFAERFGSYSTDEPVKNMADLQPLMTARMKDSLSAPSAADDSGIFSGFSTKALSSDLIEYNSLSATVIVKTQRTQTLGTGETSKSFYADLELRAVKSGDEWKIDGARWR
ncbi:MAG: hypothetical protein WC517_04055 [Patescibacteria group bacterium]